MSYVKFFLTLPIALVVAQGLRVESTPYAMVRDARLQRPEAADWLMYRRTYDGSGFTPENNVTQNGIDKIQGMATVVPKAGTVLVFKLRSN